MVDEESWHRVHGENAERTRRYSLHVTAQTGRRTLIVHVRVTSRPGGDYSQRLLASPSPPLLVCVLLACVMPHVATAGTVVSARYPAVQSEEKP